ncbi:hypothetical protein [Kribbella sp. NPDC048915]|uniref:hypothetical protein n=1 Tax=Kribbella sp. NPDC048915 TaxID=3155148 RepID=UPI0033C441DE
MLRPMVATTAVTAALILLAGCGGDDKKPEAGTENSGGETTTSTTPSAPAAPTFDPPKAFSVTAAYPVPDYDDRAMYDDTMLGMVGQAAVAVNYRGLVGHDVVDPNKLWEIRSTESDTTTVSDATHPMAVKVDGKDVAVVAYAQADKGNGTQKPTDLVLVQWIDVASGQKLAEVSTPVTEPGGAKLYISNAQYDPETGQVAVGVTSGGDRATVYADPATKKGTVLPDVLPGAVHGGVVAGAKAETKQNANDAGVVLFDGASGKATKQIPLKQGELSPIGGGAKHGYFYGTLYVKGSGNTVASLYAVDLSTGAVVPSTPELSAQESSGYTCLWDQAASLVCTELAPTGHKEIFGFDDSTGKKSWGYTSKSGDRIVPRVTAAFHGVVYVQTEKQPVLLDAKTGEDLPSAGSSASPSNGETPSGSDSPTSGDSPSGNESPSDGNSESPGTSAGGNDMSLYNGTQLSPSGVSPYGGVFGQVPKGSGFGSNDIQLVSIVMKPTA